MYWRIPVTDQFIIEPQQGNRTTSHFKRSDIAPYEGTSNGNILAAQNPGEFVGNDIEFDQRGPAHAIAKGQYALTALQAEAFNDGVGTHFRHTNAAPPGSIEAILHSYVVIGDHACDLNPFSLGQLSCHLEVQHVTGVVLDDVEHAGTAIDGACRGKHLIWHRRGKDGTRASRI